MAIEDEHLTTHFGRIWPAHVEALTELLIQLRQQFDGDLDLMLVLAIIGTRTQPARQASTMTYSQFMANDRPVPAGRPINIQSVAACSGIARETVRRKVNKLENMGFITREANGNLLVTPQATSALTPSTEASLRYMAAMRKHYKD
ncbi:DeoR family transcriptional regulator [Oceanimonas smirnovii]|uniref:DeoR family transcriptional regulator n=1 Tax=Oceanimonas smirnovii TaxID=264574 RepID=A0ABW7P1M0_9GAMM